MSTFTNVSAAVAFEVVRLATRIWGAPSDEAIGAARIRRWYVPGGAAGGTDLAVEVAEQPDGVTVTAPPVLGNGPILDALQAIPMTPVTSSNIAAVGYDAGRQVLAVRFKAGTLYHYAGVPADVHASLMAAPSVGSYFAAHVRNAYAHEKQADASA